MANPAFGVIGQGTMLVPLLCIVLSILGVVAVMVAARMVNAKWIKLSLWLIRFEVHFNEVDDSTQSDVNKLTDRVGKGKSRGIGPGKSRRDHPGVPKERPLSDGARRQTKKKKISSDPKDR
ncbi:hypothetical protein AB0L30_08395 [Microbispora rosea]|uniref:hypothetical protein n=1 Tax=Microbispora rosea TaxID=58117 RepID=UPI003447688B